MSRYIPQTLEQKCEMLRQIDIDNTEQLFRDIPESIKLDKPMNLPDPMTEPELDAYMKKLAAGNINTDDYACFLGAGAYDHYIPSVVRHVTSRQEFYTSYTQYQPEISQGMLQAIFEYQSMICSLTGMDVSNASLYDGATALAEAALMSCAVTKKNTVLVSKTVHPEYRRVLKTYSDQCGFMLAEVEIKDGITDIDELRSSISDETAAVLVQNPNFFGIIEPLDKVGELLRESLSAKNKIMFTVCADPISLAIFEPPASFGADIVVGEGQALGNPLSFGGPYLGFFTAREEYLRKMPGRIVGQTEDSQGRRGFVLTIQAREQHIRREKATSNICSNQALNALTAAVYMTVTGKEGLRDVALNSMRKAHYTCEKLIDTGCFERFYKAPFFKEFALRSKMPVSFLNAALCENKIIGGLDLSGYYPEMENGWLIAVTEKRTLQEIDHLAAVSRAACETQTNGSKAGCCSQGLDSFGGSCCGAVSGNFGDSCCRTESGNFGDSCCRTESGTEDCSCSCNIERGCR